MRRSVLSPDFSARHTGRPSTLLRTSLAAAKNGSAQISIWVSRRVAGLREQPLRCCATESAAGGGPALGGVYRFRLNALKPRQAQGLELTRCAAALQGPLRVEDLRWAGAAQMPAPEEAEPIRRMLSAEDEAAPQRNGAGGAGRDRGRAVWSAHAPTAEEVAARGVQTSPQPWLKQMATPEYVIQPHLGLPAPTRCAFFARSSSSSSFSAAAAATEGR